LIDEPIEINEQGTNLPVNSQKTNQTERESKSFRNQQSGKGKRPKWRKRRPSNQNNNEK
jgi:hypothetical protein